MERINIQRVDEDLGEPHRGGRNHSHLRRISRALIPFALATIFAPSLYSLLERSVSAQTGFSTSIHGVITDKLNGVPISGAIISIPDLNLENRSDSLGRFHFSDVSLAASEHRTNVIVSADGFGEWKMLNVLLISTDTLILDVELERSPVTIEIPELIPLERSPQRIEALAEFSSSPTIDQRDAPLPETIRVRITGEPGKCDHDLPYTVEVIDFKDYTKHVLPYEWVRDWPRESLRAGAMAVKMYAWDIVADGGRYEDADVYDSICDQVYIPGASYSSTNNAIEFTWNWRLNRSDGRLFRTHYMDWYWRCQDLGWEGFCMGQWDSYYHATGNNGYDKLNWDEMIFRYYWDSELSFIPLPPPAIFNLRFFGNGWGDYDRIKILLDDPDTGHLPVDIGATDFTIEWWMLAHGDDNQSPSCVSGGDGWTDGNVIFDRDIPGDGDFGEYGISLSNGKIAFGINNGSTSHTVCGNTHVADGKWHHVAVTRRMSDGLIQIYVDGEIDQEGLGPTGDISYRDGRTPQDLDQDPYLIIGARKSDLGPAYNGILDEVRISDVVRYTEGFQPSLLPFTTDGDTMALYHFDKGYGNTIFDTSSSSGGPSDGLRKYGGDPENGPEWQLSLLFLFHQLFMPMAVQ